MLVLMLSSDGSRWPFATKVSGPLRAHHRFKYFHVWDARYLLRTYSTENVRPHSASITQYTKGPRDHLWVDIEPPWRVHNRFEGRRPLTHLQPKLRPVGSHHVISHKGVLRPRDHLWVAIEPLWSSQGGTPRVCKRDTGADLRLCRIDVLPGGLVLQLVWNLCKTLGFDSI